MKEKWKKMLIHKKINPKPKIKTERQVFWEEVWNHVKLIPKEPKLVYDFFEGMYRQFCYDHKIPVIRKKIIAEYEWRKTETRAKECARKGSCQCCGCAAPASLFCTRACSVSKYPTCERDLGLKQCFPKMGIIDINDKNQTKEWTEQTI